MFNTPGVDEPTGGACGSHRPVNELNRAEMELRPQGRSKAGWRWEERGEELPL
jgi:hypothetical protein